MDRSEGNPAMVVNRDMNVFPACTITPAMLARACHSMSRTPESAEFLDIQVQEITWRLMLVAIVGPAWFKVRQSI
jgi:hypothetical protein